MRSKRGECLGCGIQDPPGGYVAFTSVALTEGGTYVVLMLCENCYRLATAFDRLFQATADDVYEISQAAANNGVLGERNE